MSFQSSDPPASVLAFDVGGSHVSIGLCHLKALQVLRLARGTVAPECAPADFVDLLHRLAAKVTGDLAHAAGAALAFPGPFDFVAGVSHMRHKLKSLYGVDLRAALAERFGWLPSQFHFLHDSGAFLLGELNCGAARGAARAVGIVLGTGIGSAFARNGEWITSGEGIPPSGEIWNLPYGSGIVEDLLSTRALKRDYAARTGSDLDVISIAGAAVNNPDARLVFETFGVHLGQVFRQVLAPFAPDVVVIGGGISRSAHLFLPSAQKQLNGLGFKLVTSSLLDEAPLVGAAAFWRNGSDIQLHDEAHESGGVNWLSDAP